MNWLNVFVYLTMMAVGIVVWFYMVYYILDFIERWWL